MKGLDLAPSVFRLRGNRVNELFTSRPLKPAQAMHAACPTERGENSADNPIFYAQDYASSCVKQRTANTSTGAAPAWLL